MTSQTHPDRLLGVVSPGRRPRSLPGRGYLVADLKRPHPEAPLPGATPLKASSGKIMRRILRKVAANEIDTLDDTSTLADPSVVNGLIRDRTNH